MWPEALRKYPFLRLLLPLAVGIVCGDAFPHAFSWSLFASVSAGWLAALYVCHRRCWRKMYGGMALLWLVFLGYQLSARAWAATDYDFPHREATYRVRLCEAAEEKKRSFLCPARVLGVYQSDTLRAERRTPLFLLYFAKDSAAARLQRGDELLVHVRLNPPRNNGNPDEFDYARYLRRQGGSGTAYVPAHRWRATGHDSTRTLRQAALDQRERVVDLYRRLGFRGDHLTVLSALTVGDQDDLSDDSRPVDRIDGTDLLACLECKIVRYGLDDILTIIEHPFDRNIVNVRILQTEHLRGLEHAHLPVRRKHENANALLATHGVFRCTAGIAGSRTQNIEFCLPS